LRRAKISSLKTKGIKYLYTGERGRRKKKDQWQKKMEEQIRRWNTPGGLALEGKDRYLKILTTVGGEEGERKLAKGGERNNSI